METSTLPNMIFKAPLKFTAEILKIENLQSQIKIYDDGENTESPLTQKDAARASRKRLS